MQTAPTSFNQLLLSASASVRSWRRYEPLHGKKAGGRRGEGKRVASKTPNEVKPWMRADNRQQTTTTTAGGCAGSKLSLPFFFASGGNLYNIRLADDGAVRNHVLGFLSPLKEWKISSWWRKYPGAKRGQAIARMTSFKEHLNRKKKNTMNLKLSMQKTGFIFCFLDVVLRTVMMPVISFENARLGADIIRGASIYL